MKKINESFVCINCKRTIDPARKTCRNHCPFCLTSLHVDGNIPGDRAAECWWIMRPKNYEIKHWKKRILFCCEKCGKEHWNKMLDEDDVDVLLSIIKKNRSFF
jgi:predicted RNA-binding Zn-ribbon protein involved in translation (DUF1610 family)